MRHTPGWAPWETYVNEHLGLDPTVASGSQFYDKGDGVDRGNGDWAFQVDSKYTENVSFGLKFKDMLKYVQQANSRGKHFVLALRFWLKTSPRPTDFAVIPFELFIAMVEKIKELDDGQRVG